ncbi:MAG: hypothetical protein ACOC3X_01530 [Nanoarchaeota archaeon]
MGVKDEAKTLIGGLLGAASADKIDGFSDTDPKAFLDQCKEMLGGMLGPALAEQKLQALYDRYC